MADLDLPRIFEGAIHSAIKKIQPDLAYLALTSKPEHAIRDAMALSLHRDSKLTEYKVARELHLTRDERWKCQGSGAGEAAFSKGGIDLAILDPQGANLKLIAELKAMYSFDVVRRSNKKGKEERTLCASMANGIIHDIHRTAHIAAALRVDHAYVMVIVMMPWVETDLPKGANEQLERVARYKMTKAADKVSTGASGHETRVKWCRRYFEDLKEFAQMEGVECKLLGLQQISYECGSAYGISFTLFPFLMKVSAKSADHR